MQAEIFKNIGYDNFEISNIGRVKFLNYRRTGKEKITFGNKCRKGYGYINACKDGKQETKGVHVLVAEAFIPVPERLKPLIGKRYPSGRLMLEVNHKDENPENNTVENLEWCTRKENNNYGTHNERMAKTKSIPILQYSKDGVLIKEWASIIEVERQTGFDNSAICKCCKGKLKTAYGFKWKYKES